MTTIKGGKFWVAKILFTDGTSSKKRPVLILWVDGDDVVVTAVTSAMPRTETDILLKDWVNSGLRVPSTIRLSRLDCLEKTYCLLNWEGFQTKMLSIYLELGLFWFSCVNFCYELKQANSLSRRCSKLVNP